MTFEPLPVVKTLISGDGTLIHAEFVGDNRKPCLVLIHGFTLSCLVWDDIFRETVLLDEVCMVCTTCLRISIALMPQF